MSKFGRKALELAAEGAALVREAGPVLKAHFTQKHGGVKVDEQVADDFGLSTRQVRRIWKDGPCMARFLLMVKREGRALGEAVLDRIAAMTAAGARRFRASLPRIAVSAGRRKA